MSDASDFRLLVEHAMQLPGSSHMRPVIEKELLHYDILFALDTEGLLDQLTFQGGTSLRLCYGSSRFSEDLDFSGGTHFEYRQLIAMKNCIEHYIGSRYELEVHVKEPSELKKDPDYAGIKVDKWQVTIVTAPERRDVPRQRIKIEVANIPAYSRTPRPLQVNYNFLPDGYSDTLIMTETLDEIMADKLVSLVNMQRYVRHRDIWDLRWLKQSGAKLNMQWVTNKTHDYQVEDYLNKLNVMVHNLPTIIHGTAFKNEISRFIPLEIQNRTINKDKFGDFLVLEIQELLNEVKRLFAF